MLRIAGRITHDRLTWITHRLLGVSLLRIPLRHWITLRRRHHAWLLRIPWWIAHHRLSRITHGLLRIALRHRIALRITRRRRHHSGLLRIAGRISYRLSHIRLRRDGGIRGIGWDS